MLAGHSDVNEAPITGESLPVDKGARRRGVRRDDQRPWRARPAVTRVGRDTRLARIIHLVEAAQARRAPVQSFVDRFARIYTPAVIALAAVVAVVPPLALAAIRSTWIYRALVLLVIACPCALVISTPVSIVAALSAAARNGVLIKGGAHLERLADVRVVAFDKTGTLTTWRAARRRCRCRRRRAAVATCFAMRPRSRRARSTRLRAAIVAPRRASCGLDVPAAQRFHVACPGSARRHAWMSAHVIVGNDAAVRSARHRGAA